MMSAEDKDPKFKRSAERMSQIRPSGLRKLFDLEHKLSKSMSLKILSFGLGNLNIPTMPEIIEGLKQSLDDPVTHRYSPNAGLLELRESLANKYKTKYKLDYSPEQFVVTSGCLEALLNTFVALINPGDEVLVQDPTFGYYLNQIRLSGGKPIPIQLNQEFELEPESVNESISSKTKALVLNFPSNPTGCVMNRDKVRSVVEMATDNDIIVIADESYEEIIYGHKHTCAAEFNDEKVIILSSFSKTFCMTGFRVGYAVGHPDLISPIYLVHQMNTACASTPAQIAARIALQSPQSIRDPMMKELNERRNETIKAFTSIDGIELNYNPLGAFYIYPDVGGTGMSGNQFSEFLLENCQIVVVPGDEFGTTTPNHVRVSYGFLNRSGIKEAGLRMQNCFSKQ
jgi:aspartate/methionine/tyrosine aminotransferase